MNRSHPLRQACGRLEREHSGRRAASLRLSGEDVDRCSERGEGAQLDDVVVAHADAAVRDGLSDQLRFAGAVDADDAAARPVAEVGVGTGLERVAAVEGVAGDEAPLHVEVLAERRLGAGLADRDRRAQEQFPVGDASDLEPAGGAVDDDPVPDRVQELFLRLWQRCLLVCAKKPLRRPLTSPPCYLNSYTL